MKGRLLKILRWTGIGIAMATGLTTLLLVAGYWYIQSESGREQVVEIINRQLSTAGETEVHIGRLEGDLLSRIEIFDLSLGDSDGNWLRIKHASASWQPRALLSGRLSISNLEIEDMVMLRRPRDSESTDEFQWPELPLKLSIDRFLLSDAIIERPVFGEAVLFEASGDTAIEGPDLVRSSMLITRTDGASARAQLRAILQPRSNFLQFELLLNEASGGIISRALEFEGLPALSIKAAGKGPFNKLQGSAELRAGDLAYIESHFNIAVGDQPALELEGHAQVAQLADESLRQLLASDVEFAVHGKLDDGEILLQSVRLANDLAWIETSGSLREFNAELNVRMAVDELQPFSVLAGIPLQGQATLQTFIHSDDIRRGAMASNIEATFTEVLSASDSWSTAVGPRANVSADIKFDREQQWGIQDLVVTGDRLALEASGSLKDFTADFDVTVAVDDLLPLSDIAGLPLQGQAKLQTRIHSDDIRRRASASKIRANFSEVLPPTSPWFFLTGSEVIMSGNLEFDSERHWGFRDLLVTTDAGQLNASGSIGGDDDELDLAYRLLLPQVDVLSEILGTPLAGELRATGDISGSLGTPTLTADLVSPALNLDGFMLGATGARLNIAQFVDKVINGNIDLSISNDRYGSINLASNFSQQADESLHLKELTIDSRETRLAGDLMIDLSTATAMGKLNAQNFALEPWSDLAQRNLSGFATLSLDLGNDENGQQLDLAINVTELDIALDPQQSIQIDAARGSARIEDVFGSASGALRLVASDTKISAAEFTSIAFEAKMDDPARLQGRLQAQGDLRGPFEVDLSAEYSARDQGFLLSILEIDATVFEQAIQLSGPVQLEHASSKTSLSRSTLLIADGSLTVDGEVGEEHIEARIEADGISVAALLRMTPKADFTGTVSGQAQVSGTRTSPSGELLLKFIDMRAAQPKPGAVKPISGELRGEWRDQRLHLNSTLSGFAKTSLDARASAPLLLEPKTLTLTIPTNRPIDGKLTWLGDLEPIWHLLSLHEDRFTGPGEIALNLDGTLDNPKIGGYFQVTGGSYENLQTATTLVDVNLRLEGDGDKLVMETLTATDGKSGSMEGSGFVDIIPDESYPVHLRLELNDMQLVAQDKVTFNASGDLSLEGTLAKALLSGKIVTGQSQVNLGGSLPPGVVDLDVEEINVDSATNAKPSTSTAVTRSSTFDLDLVVSVPGHAFVRGLGLESEWAGEILLNGNANSPRLAGVLRPVRGRFFVMGRSFRLEHGTIRFTGSEDVDPVLDLTAEYKADSLTALVRVTGSASRPEILLTSRPPLPESEIASQVLFGTNSGNLTTAQSLQLASAIASYSGTGGALDILSTTRRVLRVDVINFTESEQNSEQTRVSVGKYVSEGVYLEIEGGGDRDSRTSTTIEVDLSPNIRVEGGTTETGGSKAGIKWKWDY